MAKKKYKVYYDSLTEYVIEVEAENEEQAYEIASQTDGGDFTPVNDGDWGYKRTEEVKEEKVEDPKPEKTEGKEPKVEDKK